MVRMMANPDLGVTSENRPVQTDDHLTAGEALLNPCRGSLGDRGQGGHEQLGDHREESKSGCGHNTSCECLLALSCDKADNGTEDEADNVVLTKDADLVLQSSAVKLGLGGEHLVQCASDGIEDDVRKEHGMQAYQCPGSP